MVSILKQEPFSLAYQILQECPFDCDICHRRYEREERRLNSKERRELVMVLKERGLKRLTVTGGEPTLLGEELFAFLKFVHEKGIHICLSTSGYNLDISRIQEMNSYVDQLLIPFRSLNDKDCREDFGGSEEARQLHGTVVNILQWIRSTDIILEIATVVHKKNMDRIFNIGRKLLELNSTIVWRVEEYYTMGIKKELRTQFELNHGEFDQLFDRVESAFGNKFRKLRRNDGASRLGAPDFLITPAGQLVTTRDNQYGTPEGDILSGKFPDAFETRRPWSDYEPVCRKWAW